MYVAFLLSVTEQNCAKKILLLHNKKSYEYLFEAYFNTVHSNIYEK